MHAGDVIRLAKTAIAEVDAEAVGPYADSRMLQDVYDVTFELMARGVPGFDAYVVDVEEPDPEDAVVPAFTPQHGLIVAYRIAERRLREAYQSRMNQGSLGVSWTSGLESESTVSAAKAYQALITDLKKLADEMLTLEQMQRTQGTRIY